MSAGLIGRRIGKAVRKSRKGPQLIGRPTPIGIASATFAAPNLDVTFDQLVTLRGVPQYTSNAGTLPTAAALTGPNTVRLTYPAGEITSISIPYEEPSVRNSSGGFVSTSTFPV